MTDTEMALIELPIEQTALADSRALTRTTLYNLVLSRLQAKIAEQGGDFHAVIRLIARRLGREPARVRQLLSTPGDWTIENVSDLLLAIANEELTVRTKELPPEFWQR